MIEFERIAANVRLPDPICQREGCNEPRSHHGSEQPYECYGGFNHEAGKWRECECPGFSYVKAPAGKRVREGGRD